MLLSDVPASLDWTAIGLAVVSVLMGGVLVLAGYVWNRTVKQMEDQHSNAVKLMDQVQASALGAIAEFRQQNREEHQTFINQLGAVERDVAYLKGRTEAGGKKS